MCWASVGEPPVLATLEDEVIVEPPGLAADGTLREDPVTRVSRRELVVTPGTQIWFEILCPAAFTEDRVATLQRALAARGLYTGAITGQPDDQTIAAIRAYQAPLGVDSGALTRAAAERLGLIVTAPTG